MPRSSHKYTIGFEIEGVLDPDIPFRDPFDCYKLLAEHLCHEGDDAVVNRKPKSRASEYYGSSWAITSDASLVVGSGQVGFEAVSPIFRFESIGWDISLFNFELALQGSRLGLVQSSSASTHVHVKTGETQDFSLERLKAICFASIIYEWHMFQLLPEHRRHSSYCRGVMRGGGSIRDSFPDGFNSGLPHHVKRLRHEIKKIKTVNALVKYVQGNERHMLWNFANTLTDLGTVEFRGGGQSCSRRTVQSYISLAVGFIELATQEVRVQPACSNGRILNDRKSLTSHLGIAMVQVITGISMVQVITSLCSCRE